MRLRRCKRRAHKRFAVMIATAQCAAGFGTPTPAERALLRHAAGPIATISSRSRLPRCVAPGLGRIGLMLPSAPAHDLIFRALNAEATRRAPFARIATSANQHNDPLLIDNDRAMQTPGPMEFVGDRVGAE